MLATLLLLVQALRIETDAGFTKQLPLQHDYIETFQQYQDTFGGANLVVVALINQRGDIYNDKFLDRLKRAHDAVFYLPGVDRSRVKSLFSADTRYLEVTEDGFIGDRVIPADYRPNDENFRKIKHHVAHASVIGNLVSLDQNGAMVIAELLDFHPTTGEKLDYVQVAEDLEKNIRAELADDDISVHINGFAKVVGDVTDATLDVIGFFAIALVISALLLWLYCGSIKLSLLPLSCSLVAVIWEFGLLKTASYGLDPFAILVPFLVLSVGLSHGVQMVNAWAGEIAHHGANGFDASLNTFRRLAIPGTAALITDVVGFATIYLIDIAIIQEMAINAAFGVAAIIITNKMLMPILLSYVSVGDIEKFTRAQLRREQSGLALWQILARVTKPGWAWLFLLSAGGLTVYGLYAAQGLQIGDSQTGVPELRPDSRYNQDAKAIQENFGIGSDILKVMVEGPANGCADYGVMDAIDQFTWYMQQQPGVKSALSAASLNRVINMGWAEGDPRHNALPHNPHLLNRNHNTIPSAAGLSNVNCSVMPVHIFTEDHKAATLNRLITAIENFQPLPDPITDAPLPTLNYRLASGNLGVMAATNQVIEAEEKPILLWVYLVIILMCWLSFRSSAGVLSVILPLSLVSLLAYALMAGLGIGLKVATLPVVALAVGIGVDYGIYIYSTLEEHYEAGLSLYESYLRTLQLTGKAVIFTGVALGASVSTWLLSELQFQVDMGILLIFMFLANMLGAIFLLPSLAYFLIKRRGKSAAVIE